MKKLAIYVFVVLLVALIPIPTGVYKDGGTREYTALTYKIVSWKKLEDADTHYIKTKIYLFPENFKSINALWYKERKNLKNSKNAEHTHEFATGENTVDSEPRGYCGNTMSYVFVDGKKYSFWGGRSVELTDLLIKLDYKKENVCDCMAECDANTEFGTGYEINLSKSFVRCDKGQADLTEEQTKKIKEIIEWAKSERNEVF